MRSSQPDSQGIILLLLIILLAFPLLVFASRAGALDPKFGLGAIDIAGMNPNSSRDMVVQPDGKIIVVGSSEEGNNGVFAVVRFLPNGALDFGFGNGSGAVATDLTNLRDTTDSVALQADGKIVVAGHATRIVGGQKGFVLDVAVVRYNSDGSLDTTFDNDGIVITQFGNFTEVISDVAIQSDGKILVAGTSGSSFLMRYNSNGSVDTSFDGDGVAQSPPVFFNFVSNMAVQPDGKVLLAGYNHTQNLLARFNSDGSIDTSFDVDGVAEITVGTSTQTHGMTIQSDGKILVTGESRVTSPNETQVTVVRVNTDGSRDTTFDDDGLVSTPLAPADLTVGDEGWDVQQQSDGRLVVIAFSFQSQITFAILRYHANGALDTSFDFDGIATHVGEGAGNVFAFQPDGKILVGGGSLFADLIVARYLMRGNATSDFDADGLTDVSVFRPSTGAWWIRSSTNGATTGTNFGINGDDITPADYDGDGKTDPAVFRSGVWYVLRSLDGTVGITGFGISGDRPVPGHYDTDGKTDIAIFRPSDGNWWILKSSNNGVAAVQFGLNGDKPTLGDFDGDGRNDLAVFRPSNGAWYRLNSSNGAFVTQFFGISEDRPVPADFDGDEKTDVAVFRPSTGDWYWTNSGNGTITVSNFGLSEDRPSPADYDGDGKADRAVFRPSQGAWYIAQTTSGLSIRPFGLTGDIPTPGAYVP